MSNPAPPHIVCQKLSKTFKDFWMRDRVKAVDAVDLEVRPGEVFGLLGPNGSGKSTTIKMILGLLHPSSGRVQVLGRSPRDTEAKEQLGYLPEESYLYRFLSARETLEYYGKLFGIDRRTRLNRIDMLLEMVGLDKVQRRPIGEYSKGMQRRIGLAQALINDPKLLVLDEPTTGMDPIGTRQIKDLILRLKESGKTVLLCSHLLGDVEDVTDRCAIMFGGRVRKAGTIDELLARQDETQIVTHALSSEEEEQAVTALESRGLTDVSIRRGRQKLETLFLDMVTQAQAEGVATAGAGNAGTVATFLTERHADAADAKPGSSATVLDDLVQDEPEEPAKREVVVEEVKPQPDAAVLSNLAEDNPRTEPEKAPEPPRSADPPKKPADRSVLDDLL
ncbi:ABC transporter ATP-binding protein [Phycisphaera mikurensis]|nr:ABC transporter ATP-binding protein [Phycisphaera mikurensis]MBB6441521.1 ABC-2 type transport system ATP-binding protein [Phycisphaera mikurensis]